MSVVAFDESALARLSEEVDDCGFALVFAGLYRRLLGRRVSRLTEALERADADAALDAALSLKVASRAVGTHEIAELARTVERDVRRLDVAAARRVAGRLLPAAARAEVALGEYLAR